MISHFLSKSFIIKSLSLILILILSLQAIYSDSLRVTTTAADNSLLFKYEFSFPEFSPSSVIAIEKPQDSIFIRATDNFNNSLEPLTIGDFYRFELPNRDITSFTIEFSSRQTFQDIFNRDEQIFYVNSNIKLEEIFVSFDPVRPFSQIIDIHPRNFEFNVEENRIDVVQSGALEDNLFRIRYESSNDMSIATWIIVLLFIPIIFFVVLYISLKVKPSRENKSLDEYINPSQKEENLETPDNKNGKIITTKPHKLEKTHIQINNDNQSSPVHDEITYSIETDDKIPVPIDEKIKEIEKYKSQTKPSNEDLEAYIQKYFTENEQDVIRTISKHEGIVQQEILDHLPIFTKSTLSKIISKLEGKKMIERVRVGKVNKLFLGEELKKLIQKQLSTSNN